jgi:threonine dehydratase
VRDTEYAMTVSLHRIAEAARTIDPTFRGTPQFVDAALTGRLGRDVVLKVECLNPIRSFKGRGADFFARGVAPGSEVVCASAGNFGQGLAYACTARSIPVTVFAATNTSPVKVDRMRALGAEVRLVGDDYDTAKLAGRNFADERRLAWVEDGLDDRITEGAATIAVELAPLDLDTLVVPVGNGALINGVATWLAAHSPRTRIVGVCAAGAPAMADSWRGDRIVEYDTIDTIAEGVGVRIPIPSAVHLMRTLVHDMITVTDEQIMTALRVVHADVGLVLEPAGALGIAAIMHSDVSGDRIATILTGSNYTPDLSTRITKA